MEDINIKSMLAIKEDEKHYKKRERGEKGGQRKDSERRIKEKKEKKERRKKVNMDRVKKEEEFIQEKFEIIKYRKNRNENKRIQKE